MSARAIDADGTVSYVDFLANSNWLGRFLLHRATPSQFCVVERACGIFSLRAVAWITRVNLAPRRLFRLPQQRDAGGDVDSAHQRSEFCAREHDPDERASNRCGRDSELRGLSGQFESPATVCSIEQRLYSFSWSNALMGRSNSVRRWITPAGLALRNQCR